jgi:tetratricopeptide (TPR) repeat protein
MFRGQTGQALEELKSLLSSTRGRQEFRDLEWNAESDMSEAYLKQGNAALAAVCLNDMVKQKPEDKATQYKLGMVDRDLGDQRQAAEHLRIAVEGGFNNLAARVNLIEAAFQAKQSALAVRTATQLLDTPVKSAPVLLRVGGVLFDHLFYRQALKAFEKAREAAPDSFEPRFRAALTSYLLEANEAAVTTLQNDVSTSPEAASLVASAKAKLGQFRDAEEILRKTIERSPQNPHAYINLALIELDQGKRPEGEMLLEQLAAMKTGAKVFYTMKRNNCGEIAKDVQPGNAELDPAPAKAAFYYQLAVQLQRGSNYLSAAELIDLAWSYGEKSAQSLYVAAESCLNQDPLSAASVLLLQKAVRADSNFAQAYYLLGRACVRQGQIQQAAQAFRRAAELKSDPDYFVALGKALKSEVPVVRARAEARTAYEQALKIDGSNAPAHLELGRLFVEEEEFDKAKPELEKALDLEPDFYEAAYLLGRFYHRQGDEQRSRKYMAQFAETKKALLEQSVIGAGYLGDGR